MDSARTKGSNFVTNGLKRKRCGLGRISNSTKRHRKTNAQRYLNKQKR